jgi:hypothetical protein
MVRDLLNHARESPAVKISGVTQNWPFLNHAVFRAWFKRRLQFRYAGVHARGAYSRLSRERKAAGLRCGILSTLIERR